MTLLLTNLLSYQEVDLTHDHELAGFIKAKCGGKLKYAEFRCESLRIACLLIRFLLMSQLSCRIFEDPRDR